MSLINFPEKIYTVSMNWSDGDDSYMTIQTVSNPWKIVPHLMWNTVDYNNRYLTIDVECLYEHKRRRKNDLWMMTTEIEIIVQFKNEIVTKKLKHYFFEEQKKLTLGKFMKFQNFYSTKLELMIQTNFLIYDDYGITNSELSIPRNIDSEIVCRLGEHILYLDKYPLICFSTQFRKMLSRSDVLEIPKMTFCYADYVCLFRLMYGQKQYITEENYFALINIANKFGVEFIISYCEDFLINYNYMCIANKLNAAAYGKLAKVQAKIVENITIKEIDEVFERPRIRPETEEILKMKLIDIHYQESDETKSSSSLIQ